jgi:hypothetical protein
MTKWLITKSLNGEGIVSGMTVAFLLTKMVWIIHRLVLSLRFDLNLDLNLRDFKR